MVQTALIRLRERTVQSSLGWRNIHVTIYGFPRAHGQLMSEIEAGWFFLWYALVNKRSKWRYDSIFYRDYKNRSITCLFSHRRLGANVCL